jgi:5-methylcytosine-specific restriction endonuclease McrA
MPRRPDVPCTVCGTLMWRGTGSSDRPICRPCRRETGEWWAGSLPQNQRRLGACSREGCRSRALARDLCPTHYSYWYRREVSGEWRKGGWISRERRLAIYERDGWTCALCGEPVDREADPQRSNRAASLDHIAPVSTTLFADNSDANLRTAHRGCNSSRGARTEAAR